MLTKVMLVCVLCSAAAWAQNAELSGLIHDPSSLSVVNAQISVRNEQTGGKRITRSNASGFYSVYSLSPGTYRVTIQAADFQTIIREGVKLDVGENARIDFVLTIGDTRTVVTVSGNSPILNTEDASVGTIISRNLIDQLPLNGRGIQSLIELTPGVTIVPVTSASRGQFSVNGQRSDSNYFTVDGVSANFAPGVFVPGAIALGRITSVGPDASFGQGGSGALPSNNFLGTFSNLVSPDALQEFRIQTSTFAPEFGRSPGAEIGLATRSGTNRYSGSIFEYVRNDVMDAKDWFADQLGLSKAPLRFNDFGGSLGGPIRIPRLYNGRDRTFFFSSYEALSTRQPQSSLEVLVPTEQVRVQAPSLTAPLLEAFPLPNRPQSELGLEFPGWGAFAGNSSIQVEQRTYGLRLDHYLKEKLIFFTRYNHAPSERVEPIPSTGIDLGINPANIQQYSIGTEMLTFGVTHMLSPNLVNEIRFNGSRQNLDVSDDVSGLGGARRPPNSLLFPNGYSSSDSAFRSEALFSSLVLGEVTRYSSSQVQFVDNLSHTLGRHQLKIGLDYRWLSSRNTLPRLASSFIFADIEGPQGISGGVSYADVVTHRDGALSFSIPTFSSYAQDTWRVNQRLTLTYGLRWELNPAPRIDEGQLSVIRGLKDIRDLSSVFLVPPGAELYPTQYSNFAPRLGLAWLLFDGQKLKTVMRMGAGLFYDLGQSGFEDSAYQPESSSIYLKQSVGSFPSSSPDTSTGGNTVPYAVAAVSGYTLPRTYGWNFTIEQSAGPQTFSAAYVGALGRRLVGRTDLPSVTTGDGASIEDLHVVGNNTSSAYHSLQLQFNRRLASRAQVLLSYTWSHSIDNLSNDLTSPLAASNPLEYLVPNINRGSSDFDIRHSLNGAVVVTPPSPRSRELATVFGHWTASSIFFARSAPPTDLYLNSLDAYYYVRPNLVPEQPLYLYGPGFPGGKSYNSHAFQAPPAGVLEGNLGRNVLRGFGAWQIDFALHRDINISERMGLQIRAEAFNILNHPNFANPSLLLGDPQRTFVGFGVSQQTLANALASSAIPGELSPLFQVGGPRTLQLSLRLRF